MDGAAFIRLPGCRHLAEPRKQTVVFFLLVVIDFSHVNFMAPPSQHDHDKRFTAFAYTFCMINSYLVSVWRYALCSLGFRASLRSLSGWQCRGSETLRARAIHLRVPRCQHTEIPGCQRCEGRLGWPRSRRGTHGAHMGQGSFHW